MLVMLQSAYSWTDRSALILTGRFDAAEVRMVRNALRAVIESAAEGSTVALNLAAVNFLDSRALLALMAAHEAALATGVTVRLTATSMPVQTLLQLTGVSAHLVPVAA